MKDAIRKLRIGKNFGVRYLDKNGKTKARMFYADGFARKSMQKTAGVDTLPNTVIYSGRTKLMDRLAARKCELCGKCGCDLEMHHVRKLKDLKGKSHWERLMITKNRKTIALCVDCHQKLHGGKLN